MTTRLYVGLGVAIFVGNIIYAQYEDTRISSIENNVAQIGSDIKEIKEAVLEQQPTAIKYNEKDIECLARNVYYEAGVEPLMGKYAVANVTINRVKSGYWGRHVCDVVYAKDQFSWTREKKRAWVELKGEAWATSRAVAESALKQRIAVKQLKHALFYHADYVNPTWRDNSKKVLKVGQHIFYTQAKGSNLSI